MKLNVAELDCIFISYDEPNAEAHWADLLNKCMWAKRVHGVKGSDACHKAAAELSETDWFITVDADNIVDIKFFDQMIDVPSNIKAFSWPGINILNGLRYGNGSLKVWNKEFVLNMQTHEIADREKGKVDFCWDQQYRPLIDSYSITYPNSSSYQAWRAGFREGVKMSLVDGIRVTDPHPDKLHWHNLHRLKVWCSVGAHVDNGLWAILGARHGCYKINCTDWDYTEVRDFDNLAEIFKEVSSQDITTGIAYYGDELKQNYRLDINCLDVETSRYVVELLKDQFDQAAEQVRWTLTRRDV